MMEGLLRVSMMELQLSSLRNPPPQIRWQRTEALLDPHSWCSRMNEFLQFHTSKASPGEPESCEFGDPNLLRSRNVVRLENMKQLTVTDQLTDVYNRPGREVT
jgi:hypothetical protein